MKLCQSEQQCKTYTEKSYDVAMGKYTECQEYTGTTELGTSFFGDPQCCSFGSFTVPNGSDNCAATDNYNLFDLGDCAGRVFDFDKPITGNLALSEDIEGRLRIYVILYKG